MSGARSGRPRKAIIYVRQSTQKEESISPETQVEHCMTACRRSGYEVVGEPIIDLNLSGRSFKRRSINPIIDRVGDGQANVVMVWKWSRWGRNLVESLLCLAELKQAGGQLESATEPIDATTPAGRFSVTQMLAIAEFQSDQIGESWRDAKRSMIFKKHLPPSAGPRFGYSYDRSRKMYFPDEVAGLLLHTAYRRYVSGASFHELTGIIRRAGVPTTRGNPMGEAALRWSMDSGFAAGLIKLDKPEALLTEEQLDDLDVKAKEPLFLPGAWEPVIDMDLWRDYGARRRERHVVPRRARNPKQALSSLLRCAGCGRRMVFRPERDRWQCSHSVYKGTTNPCPVKVTVDGAEALAFARAWVRAHKEGSGVHAESLIQRRFQAQKAGAHLDALAREVTRAEDRRKNLLNLAADGTLTKLEVRDGLDAIKVELEGAQSNLAFAKRQAAVADLPENHSFGALDAAWERMSPPVLNRGMLEVMDALFIYPFRNQPRMIARGVWEKDKEIPVAETPDLDFSDGRLCLGCHQWKSEDAFYRRTRGAVLMSRCKRCKQQEHLAWKERKAASTHAAELGATI